MTNNHLDSLFWMKEKHYTEEEQSSWSKTRFGWWAPGHYYIKCVRCDKGYIGDKRSGHCYPCALKQAKEDIENNKGANI